MVRERSDNFQLWGKGLRIIWITLTVLGYRTVGLFAQDMKNTYPLISYLLPSHANYYILRSATK